MSYPYLSLFHSSHFPDIVGRDAQKRKEARVHWQTTTRRLLTQLHFYARLAGLSKGQLEKYSLSSKDIRILLYITYIFKLIISNTYLYSISL